MTVPATFKGYGVNNKEDWANPKLVEFERKATNPHDVIVKIIACGVCGSDLHTVKGGWGPYNRKDLVVGHEVVGTVVAVGDAVTNFKLGQRVGIGAAVSACREGCNKCENNCEQRCPKLVGTYNTPDPRSDNYVTQGGYADHTIADEDFVFPIPDELSSEEAAPLMCAGLTVFSPMRRHLGDNLTNKIVGIVGLGGLGHLAIQFAHHLGAKVIVFSRSDSKKQDAIKMGADEFIATGTDKDWQLRYQNKLDFVLSCAYGVDLDLSPFLSALDIGKKFCTVGIGAAGENFTIPASEFGAYGADFVSSLLGSKEDAIKMFEVAAKYGIRPWIEKIPMGEAGVSEALTKLDQGDVRYRSVLTDFDKAF